MMGTVVTIQVVGHGANATERAERDASVMRATEWFHQVEACCSRFDATSELRQLTCRVGEQVPASPILLEIVTFALALAEESGGAFDPTVGGRMEARGFDRHYRTGVAARTDVALVNDVTYRDVSVDPATRTITLHRPLVLDLGAVAKGFAIDLAARELAPLGDFAIDAGGDLYLAGHNAGGAEWAVGIRHPRDASALLDTIFVSDTAVCTSGDYERTSAVVGGGAAHHIMDPHRCGGEAGDDSATCAASVTVVAPLAMVADGLATAAFVLGPERGLELLNRHGVRGLIVTPSLERFATRDA
jgi:thiamine biosynthesis lipoprotein